MGSDGLSRPNVLKQRFGCGAGDSTQNVGSVSRGFRHHWVPQGACTVVPCVFHSPEPLSSEAQGSSQRKKCLWKAVIGKTLWQIFLYFCCAEVSASLRARASPMFNLDIWTIGFIREKQRGVENSGEGKTYHKTPPPKRFWTLPPMIRPPPPRLFTPCHFLRGNEHRPDESHFLRPPKLVWRGRSIVPSPLPLQKIARYVSPAPPPFEIPQLYLGCCDFFQHQCNGSDL